MIDAIASVLLAGANLAVAGLNGLAWSESRELRDMCATAAWAGSTLYWVVRAAIATGAM